MWLEWSLCGVAEGHVVDDVVDVSPRAGAQNIQIICTRHVKVQFISRAYPIVTSARGDTWISVMFIVSHVILWEACSFLVPLSKLAFQMLWHLLIKYKYIYKHDNMISIY